MKRPARKPDVAEAVAGDPVIGRRVRVLRGVCAGKEGKAVNAFRGRIATADRIMIQIDGSMPGWLISALPEDIEVLPAGGRQSAAADSGGHGGEYDQ